MNFDILSWYKVNSCRDHILLKVACYVIVISVSTRASKSAFSITDSVPNHFQNNLSPIIVESHCVHNWLCSSFIPISLSTSNR